MAEFTPEPERCEFTEGPAYRFVMNRREFAGLSVFLLLAPAAFAQESGGGGRRSNGQAVPREIGAWLHIGEAGEITVYTGKVEMGQNIRTSLAQAVAEEFGLPVSRIRMVMGDTALTPWDLGTVGSMTTPIMAPQLRKAAAAAREMVLDLAVGQSNTPRGQVRIAELNLAELTRGQKLSKTIAPDVPLIPAADWKIAGHDLHKVNARSIVTGEEKYTSDMKLPGMLYGRVVRRSALSSSPPI